MHLQCNGISIKWCGKGAQHMCKLFRAAWAMLHKRPVWRQWYQNVHQNSQKQQHHLTIGRLISMMMTMVMLVITMLLLIIMIMEMLVLMITMMMVMIIVVVVLVAKIVCHVVVFVADDALNLFDVHFVDEETSSALLVLIKCFLSSLLLMLPLWSCISHCMMKRSELVSLIIITAWCSCAKRTSRMMSNSSKVPSTQRTRIVRSST